MNGLTEHLTIVVALTDKSMRVSLSGLSGLLKPEAEGGASRGI